MSQTPPPMTPSGGNYSIPGPSRTNGLAIASMICSVTGLCVLFIGGLVGVILGILGLVKTRNGYTGGKGMAVAGIVIGILSILTSCIISYGFYVGFQAGVRSTAPVRAAARQFVVDLSQGDVAKARTESTADLTDAQLDAISDRLKARGTFMDMTSTQFNAHTFNGVASYQLSGIAQFSSGSQPYNITLLRQSDKTWKVSVAQFP